MCDAGFEIVTFPLDEFFGGAFISNPLLPKGAQILYRGWMLSGSEYENLLSAVAAEGAALAIDQAAYLASHHLPNWYPLILDLTPETRIFPATCDLEHELQTLGWPAFFVKDYVKSLKTSTGSIITELTQVKALVADMKRFRGVIEGGFCVRKVESFLPATERRFFVLDGEVFAESGGIPPIVQECIRRLNSRFYSVDVIEREDGHLRIVEIGDGQVSDLVGWTPERFASILAGNFLNT